MSSHRPHVATVRLTEAQHVLARQRFVHEPGMSWQRLLTSCVNAYIKGEIRIRRDGSVHLEDAWEESDPVTAAALERRPAAVSYDDHPDAVNLESLTEERPAISFEDDPDALCLEDLELLDETDDEDGGYYSVADLPDASGRAYGSQEERTIGTRELAALAEERTGRRVNLTLLRQLVRERFPQGEPGPGMRYRWRVEDPQIDRIVSAIDAGALTDLRQRRLAEAALADVEGTTG